MGTNKLFLSFDFYFSLVMIMKIRERDLTNFAPRGWGEMGGGNYIFF